MKWTAILPAYGRKYLSAKAARADFHADKYFILANVFDPYDGKPCNKTNLVKAGYTTIELRYGRENNRMTIIRLKK